MWFLDLAIAIRSLLSKAQNLELLCEDSEQPVEGFTREHQSVNGNSMNVKLAEKEHVCSAIPMLVYKKKF